MLSEAFKDAWDDYRGFLGSAAVATLLGTLWAIFGTSNEVWRFLPIVVLLSIFLGFYLKSAISADIRRQAQIAKRSKVLEFKRNVVIRIDEHGNSSLSRRTTVANKGVLPYSGTLDESFAYSAKEKHNDWKPEVKIYDSPPEKELVKLYQHSYDYSGSKISATIDQPLRVFCWGYQIRPFLDPGESVEFEYAAPTSPEADRDAFTEKGSVIAVSIAKTYTELNFLLHGPARHRFEILSFSVYATDGSRSAKEEKWARKKFAPTIDKVDGTMLRWTLAYPIPRFRYVCKYRLVSAGDFGRTDGAAMRNSG